MAEAIGSAGGGHPDLNLTTEERRVYGELLKEADPDGFGAVSGDVAVKFFERTKLAPDVLGQIWQIADTENRGFLTPSGFGVVLRLIGHAQAGRVPAASLSSQAAPLPRFDDSARQPPVPAVATAPAPAPLTSQLSGTPSSPSSGPGPIRVPPLTPEKVNEYSALFEKSGAENGSLSGMVAKQIFERARLPNDVLGRIWFLADTQGRGLLDVTEFVIAMHLLASYKSGQMRGVPNTLPAGLYDAASRRPPPRMSAASPQIGTRSPIASAIPPQFSGYGGRPQSPITRQQAGTPLSAQSTGDGWAVTPVDKARFDEIFTTVDRQGLGFITGEQAVTFFGNARLPEETLAQIWDLADINSEGRLNRDQFAVAMYLIRQQRSMKDRRGNLPPTLPPALVPPSMRKQVIPPSQPTAPAFENAPITQPRSAAEDLFGLDVLSPQPAQPAPAQVAQSTGGTDTGPFGSPKSPTIPPPAAASASTMFAPFKPSSSFGQSMFPQSTGPASPSQNRSVPAPAASEDLLGDGDANISSKLTNETAELGNLSNQIGTLSKEMTDLQAKRLQAEQEISQNAQQKRTFETRLSQLRTAFDKEVQEFKALQEQLTTSRNEKKRLQQDIAMIEGNHADTRRQHDQLRAGYEADQQENTSLKERIRQINVENDQLKPQIEKLKSDARQQKGMVAINKKQLATNELERERLKAELAAAQKEIDEANREIEETARQIEGSRKEHEEAIRLVEASKKEREETARQAEASKRELGEVRALPIPTVPAPVPAPIPAPASATTPAPVAETRSVISPEPPLASPTPSNMSNPFMRRDGSTVFSPPINSPEPTHDHSAFDSIFGPAFGAAAAASAAPSTSFRSETPVNQPIAHAHVAQSESVASTSTGQDVVEPPAPPSGRQMTSDALPFRSPLERTDSMTSSVKVVPPASRLSPVDTPRAVTPAFSTPVVEKLQHGPFGVATPDAEQESVRQTLPRTDTTEKTNELPGAFPSNTPRSQTPAQGVNPTAIVIGAGATAVAAGAGLAAAATHQGEQKQNEKEKESEVPAAGSSTSQANNFDEYFGGPAHQRTPSEQVKDFDDAFATMSNGPPAENGTKASAKEFPDIQEVDGDSSSESSEEVPMEFDDNFDAKPANATASRTETEPATGMSSKAAGKQPEVASALPSYLRPTVERTVSNTSNTSSLPGFEQQTSPPTYKDSVPEDNPSHFPREYKGLLPEREDPTSPPLPTAGGSSHPGPNPSGAPAAYGPEAARTQSGAVAQTESSMAKSNDFDFDSAFAGMEPPKTRSEAPTQTGSNSGPKTNAFDFDTAFAGMEPPKENSARATSTSAAKPNAFDFDSAFAAMGPAQVQEDDSDEADTTFGLQRNQVPEFDPSFDSPIQSRAPTVTSVNQSPMTAHDAVTNGAAPSTKSSSNHFFGGDNNIVSPRPAQATSSSAAPAISHDWDALFAPLDTSSAPNSRTIGAGEEPQRIEISPEVNARTSAAEVSGTLTPVAGPAAAKKTTPIPSSGLRVERPQPGRALSAGTEHDDPILKRLTAMGWSRTDSLAALEKFDYNIDKAADYLTFRS